jgi:hypothetical protein
MIEVFVDLSRLFSSGTFHLRPSLLENNAFLSVVLLLTRKGGKNYVLGCCQKIIGSKHYHADPGDLAA